MAVTLDGEYVHGKQYDILVQVYNAEDGCSYVSRKRNINVRPGTDPDTWQKVSNKGDIGATGLTPNIKMGTVVTGDAGTQADATITGTPEEPVINLTIPRGDPGEGGGGGSDPNAVKYTEQELTDAQKTQARENIGAISSKAAEPTVEEINLYPTVNYTAQSLTEEQKAQARTNIGAGTNDFSGDYRDLSNKPTIPTVPETSTNINADRYNNDKVAGTKAVYEEVHPKVETVRYSWGMSPNVMYNLGELTGNVVFLFATPEDNTIVNHYYFCFDVGNTIPTITWPVEITAWFGMAAPTIVAGHHYEVSVINGVAAYLEV